MNRPNGYHALKQTIPAILIATGLLTMSGTARAQITDLATSPLSTTPTASVLPNLMFVLDDSGSMGWDYMPDNVNDNNTCITRNGSASITCQAGDPPYYAAEFNYVYYNPQITYTPGVNADGTSLGAQGSPWTAVRSDPYTSATTVNLTNGFRERKYCDGGGTCKRNGIDNGASFIYNSVGYPDATYTTGNNISGAPFYFTIAPREYCSDTNLTTCTLSATATGSYVYPASVRYCRTQALAGQAGVVSGGTPDCRKKFDATNYKYPRFGTFTRTDILPATATYGSRPNRTDCASAPTCTYAEEITNFANWYAYYRTRIQMMKTSAGLSFLPVDDRYRVGLITINPGSPVSASKYLAISKFDATQKSAWYTKLYAQTVGNSTPLREAMSRVGRHYANKHDDINQGMPEDPVQYSCQQNFTLLTTDGYWNGNAGVQLNGTSAVGNQDGTAPRPYFDGASTTITDVTTTVQEIRRDETVTPATATKVWQRFSYSLGNDGANGCKSGRRRVLSQEQQRTETLTTTTTSVDDFTTTDTHTVVTTNGVVTSDTTTTTVTPANVSSNTVTNSDTFTAWSNVGSPTNYGSCSSNPSLPNPNPSNATLLNSSTANGTPTVTTLSSSGPYPPSSTSSTTSSGGTSDTLADVAMYYYQTDLRPTGSIGALGGAVDTNNVPTTSKDTATHQHMTTFTLGLGLDGLMDYRSDYETATVGDYYSVWQGLSGCSWVSGTCNWPIPAANSPMALDDLWHAAVNGRGTYFSARDPASLSSSISTALSGMAERAGAAAAAATSSPNITPTDRSIFSSTYRTAKWDGEVIMQYINSATGAVEPTVIWSAKALLDTRATASADTRTIYAPDSVTANKLKAFDWASLSATEKGYFNNKCSTWSQCTALNMTAADMVLANNGQHLVEWLRGWSQYNNLFRTREHLLGDTVDAQPAYVRAPSRNFADAVTPSYDTFKSAQASRQAALYIAANDGMLHAFNADSGAEIWGYVPGIVMPNLYKLAETDYANHHVFNVDGTPTTMDVFDDSNPANKQWRTILVAGLNSGGRGYYALDITDPNNPKGLWEFCSDATLCTVSDSDLGYTYGNPIITKRATDGKWVVIVTSGYNNVSPGDGRGYLYVLDAISGAILSKYDTAVGSTTAPSGLGKISAWADNFDANNTALRVYGGDLLGNVWRFDLGVAAAAYPSVTSAVSPQTILLAELRDASNRPQPVTTRPELGDIYGNPVVFVGTGRYLGVSDLSDPATLVPAQTTAYQQSIYAFKDLGTAMGDIHNGGTLVQQTLGTGSPPNRTASTNPVDWTVKDGWYIDLNPANTSPGERVNVDPQLVLGTLLVVANVPESSACTAGGSSYLYQLNYATGSFIATAPNQVAGQYMGSALTVGIVVYRLPSGALKGVVTSATGSQSVVGVNIGATAASGRRVSWREIED